MLIDTSKTKPHITYLTIQKIKSNDEKEVFILKNMYGTPLWLQFESRQEAKEWAKTNGYEIINFRKQEEAQ